MTVSSAHMMLMTERLRWRISSPCSPCSWRTSRARRWSSFAACGASIRRAEAAAGRQYEAVALTRPDLVWYGSVQPFCLQDLTQTTVHRGPAKWNSTLEWLLLMPRNHAESLLATATLFDRCAPGERCCAITRSEDLLLHALNTVGRWRHIPFAIDILRDTHHAGMRNAGCAQPDALGFASTAACKRIVFGQAGGAGEPVSAVLPTTKSCGQNS